MQTVIDFFKSLPWYIMYPGKAVVAVAGGYVSQNPQIFPSWAVLLGAVVTVWVVLAFVWHALNTWREHNQKPRLRLEPSHLIILGLAIALAGVVWQMRIPRQDRVVADAIKLSDEDQAKKTLPPLSEFEWGFERHPGYPFIGMLGGKHANPPVVFQFQAQGRNNTKDPIVKVRAYVRSDRTGVTYNGLFNINGRLFESDAVNPIPVGAIIDIHAYFDPKRGPLSIDKFLGEIAPLTFFFEYDGKQYRHSFSQSEIELLVRRFEEETRPQTPPPRMTAKPNTKESSLAVSRLFAFQEGRSGLEAAKLLEPFKGIRIPPTDGKVGVISPDGSSDGAMVVIKNGKDALECHFEQPWVQELYQYKKGDLLRVTGRISHFTGPSLLVLTGCEIAK